jgi:hypothetical protein
MLQDILELWRRKYNKLEIAEEIAPWLIVTVIKLLDGMRVFA